MRKAYIAAPFFNPKQLEIVEQVKGVLDAAEISYFSPKDENLFKQGDNPKLILNENCYAIRNANVIVVITDDKDVGTIWEAGYAYAHGKDIIYLWLGYKPDMKFNIMLAASGDSVVHTYVGLYEQMVAYRETGRFLATKQEGILYE